MTAHDGIETSVTSLPQSLALRLHILQRRILAQRIDIQGPEMKGRDRQADAAMMSRTGKKPGHEEAHVLAEAIARMSRR